MSRLRSERSGVAEPWEIPVYDRYDETKECLSSIDTPGELEVKLREMMEDKIMKGEDGTDRTKDVDLPITTAYQLFAHKLDIAWLRVIAQYKKISELLPFDVRKSSSYCDLSQHLHILAARKGSIDVIRYLLEVGIDVNGFYKGKHLMLHVACYQGHIEVVEILLQHGADPSIQDCKGNRASYYAVGRNRIEIIDRLYLAGASFTSCHPWGGQLKIETVIRLFDLRVLKGKDLTHIVHLSNHSNHSYHYFFSIYNTLYDRDHDVSEDRDGKKEAYRYLAETLQQLSLGDKGEHFFMKDLLGHFMVQCLGCKEENEELRQVIFPYLHFYQALGGSFHGTMLIETPSAEKEERHEDLSSEDFMELYWSH